MTCPGSLRDLSPRIPWHLCEQNLSPHHHVMVTSHWTNCVWELDISLSGLLWFNSLHFQDHREHFSLPYSSQASHTLSRRSGTLGYPAPAPAPPPVMIGVMRFKRDLIFGRWQERTFVLTNKYLKSFDRNHMKIAGTTSLPQQPQAKPQVLWKVTWLICNESEFHPDILLLIHILDRTWRIGLNEWTF